MKVKDIDPATLYKLYIDSLLFDDPKGIVDIHKKDFEDSTGFKIDDNGNVRKPECVKESGAKTLTLSKDKKSSN
jgi:hypothetical protein